MVFQFFFDPASPFPRCGAAACRPVSPLAVDFRCRRLFGRCDSRLGLCYSCVGCRRYCCIRLCGWFSIEVSVVAVVFTELDVGTAVVYVQSAVSIVRHLSFLL